MNQTIDTYPIFESNQVLTNRHLNMVVEYLDEQSRLTRSNLIGIGIACGLELEISTAEQLVRVGRGCAVTSEGYLIVEPDDVELTAFRKFQLSAGDRYAPFMVAGRPIDLWELSSDGEPNTTDFVDSADFLDDKAILLFVELDQEDLSDCSPNNCDDKGVEVHVNVRRLALKKTDAARLIEDQEWNAVRAKRLELPDVRTLRYDVPKSTLVSSKGVLKSFQETVKRLGTVSALSEALREAYRAYKPLVEDYYASNPFQSFNFRYRFLEGLPSDPTDVRFLQYYMDFLEDVVAAYDEFRWRGLDLACQCCPSRDLFPRHVILGPEDKTLWLASPAAGESCEALRAEVISLFQRLVEITRRFSNSPSLPSAQANTKTDNQIKITPSRLGPVPLSAKAIPYYYELNGTPPLYEVWSHELTRRDRSNQNLGYRASDFGTNVPDFIQSPLKYDLEPHDFFRIEGHLGKNYQSVLQTLVTRRDRYRLPFDIVALRTGDLSDDSEFDIAEHECIFRDLNALFLALRAELVCLLRKSLATFSWLSFDALKLTVAGSPVANFAATTDAAAVEETGTLTNFDLRTAGFKTEKATREDLIQNYFSKPDTLGFLLGERGRVGGFDNPSSPTDQPEVIFTLESMALLMDLILLLNADLHEMEWGAFEEKWTELQELSEKVTAGDTSTGDGDGLSLKELNRQITALVYACGIEGLFAIRDEYARRVQELRELELFSNYAERHPSLQHKAGVPVGGTFVLVYHQSADRSSGSTDGSSEDPYANAVAEISSGSVIADFYLPYMCKSDCMPIQYNIVAPEEEPEPAEPPELTAIVGCTSDNGVAEVKPNASGGTPPYQLSIDGAAAQEFVDLIVLSPGIHTLEVIDSVGTHSVPMSLTVPERLSAGEPSFVDDVVSEAYTASIQLQGGTSPYTASQGSISGDVLEVGPIRSGESVTMEVTDAVGCSLSISFQHTVDIPCDKPCDGAAVRVRYPIWIHPVGQQTLRIDSVKIAALRITDEAGNRRFQEREALPEIIGGLLNGIELNAANYLQIMREICDRINEQVEARLGPNDFVLTPDTSDIGTFTVDSYSCHNFLLQIQFSTVILDKFYTEDWTYTRNLLVVKRLQPELRGYRANPIDSIAMDRCADTIDDDCRVLVRSILPRPADGVVTLAASFDRGLDTAGFEYFWRVETPDLFSSRSPTIEISTANVQTLVFHLSVRTPDGCWDFVSGSMSATRRTALSIPRRTG